MYTIITNSTSFYRKRLTLGKMMGSVTSGALEDYCMVGEHMKLNSMALVGK
jgi:hypothetical protein